MDSSLTAVQERLREGCAPFDAGYWLRKDRRALKSVPKGPIQFLRTTGARESCQNPNSFHRRLTRSQSSLSGNTEGG